MKVTQQCRPDDLKDVVAAYSAMNIDATCATFFDDLPKELEESARIDGCGRLRVYFYIALPLAKPAIAVLAIFNVLTVWNEYLLAMLVLSRTKG